MLTKFEMEGNLLPQPFIAYGALFAAPARDDSLVASRRDYTYAVSTDSISNGLSPIRRSGQGSALGMISVGGLLKCLSMITSWLG